MFKRIFWFCTGLAAGLIIASKASGYVRAHTPRMAREFVLGPDQDNIALRTLGSIVEEFKANFEQRESQLNDSYAHKYGKHA